MVKFCEITTKTDPLWKHISALVGFIAIVLAVVTEIVGIVTGNLEADITRILITSAGIFFVALFIFSAIRYFSKKARDRSENV